MADSTGQTLNIERILELLPHRYPFLLVDKIINVQADESAVGIKNVTVNEPFFPGHFPGNPVMPGVLIVEAMAQTAGAICVNALGTQNNLVYFMSIDNAKFRRPVVPGDTLHLHVTKLKQRRNIWKFECQARVEDQLVSEATITAMMGARDDAAAA